MSINGKMAAFEILYFKVVVCMERKEDSSLVGDDTHSTYVPITKRIGRRRGKRKEERVHALHAANQRMKMEERNDIAHIMPH